MKGKGVERDRKERKLMLGDGDGRRKIREKDLGKMGKGEHS